MYAFIQIVMYNIKGYTLNYFSNKSQTESIFTNFGKAFDI